MKTRKLTLITLNKCVKLFDYKSAAVAHFLYSGRAFTVGEAIEAGIASPKDVVYRLRLKGMEIQTFTAYNYEGHKKTYYSLKD